MAEIVSMLEDQRKGLLGILGSQNYIDQLFPAYQKLKEKIDAVEIMYSETDQRKKAFSEWQREWKSLSRVPHAGLMISAI